MKRILRAIILGSLLIPPWVAQAEIASPIGTTDLRLVVGNLIKAMLGISGIAALLMFVWGGLLWMTSAGNSERVDKGKQTLTWAVIGLVVIFTSYTLVSLVIQSLSGSTS